MPNYSGIWTRTQQMQATAASLWPATPGAPTIGTATGGNTSASVTFTAPAYTGNPAGITSFTVTSSPSGVTGTGASSPITVSGLTNGTAYTFTVTATNATGTGSASAASNSVTPAMTPGMAFGGGYFAGQVNVSGTLYNMVIADVTTGQVYGKKWGTYGEVTSAQSLIDGAANTARLLVVDRGFLDYQAAIFCSDLVTGGYSDWYLPARNELEVCYYFLKPTTTANTTGFSSGVNANAVSPEPVSTVYTSGSPTQTTATNFRTGASSQEFTAAYYWSSSESTVQPAYVALGQDFSNGTYYNDFNKTYTTYYTRAMRKVLA
jgi:hypothetical protein